MSTAQTSQGGQGNNLPLEMCRNKIQGFMYCFKNIIYINLRETWRFGNLFANLIATFHNINQIQKLFFEYVHHFIAILGRPPCLMQFICLQGNSASPTQPPCNQFFTTCILLKVCGLYKHISFTLAPTSWRTQLV